MTERPVIENPYRAERAERDERERARLRDRANSLLGFAPFRDWLGDLMVSVGFFGEGRELTPYQQGRRGGVVQEVERLCEFADAGPSFLADVFKGKVCRR